MIAVCGMGKVFSAICAQTMILEYKPELIINTGVGGALSPELTVFNVVVADKTVQHDMDNSPIGFPKAMIAELGITYFECDRAAASKIRACIEKRGAKCFGGVIASGDTFVADNELKSRLIADHNAIACDMESGAIAQVCCVNNVGFVAVRAMSDSANGDSTVDFPTFAAEAANRSAEAIIDFITN